MNFKDMLQKISQLNEATEKTKTGTKHLAEPGGYGRKYDIGADDSDEPKKKRGGQEKDEGPKFGKDTPKNDLFGRTTGKAPAGKKGTQITPMKDADKAEKKNEKEAKKKGLKEWMQQLTDAMNEAEQISVQPAQSSTQVIKQGSKTLGTVTNPQLAAQIKQSIGKGEMTLNQHEQGMAEDGGEKWIQKAIKHPGALTKKAQSAGMSTSAFAKKHAHDSGTTGKQARLAQTLSKMHHQDMEEADMPPNDSLMSPISEASKRTKADDKAEKAGKKVTKDLEYDMGHKGKDDAKAERAGKKVAKDIEYDEKHKTNEEKTVTRDNRAEKAGKKVTKDLEYDMGHKGKDDNKAERAGKKVTKDIEYDEKKKLPSMAHIKKMCKDGKTIAEICKMHPDCDRTELKKMVADCKKKMVKEGMDERLHAARAEGKAHGLRGHSHCGRNYDNMEEARCYHEGYKQGLDECYGQMPIQGYVGETEGEMPASTLPGMASQAQHGGMSEGATAAAGYSPQMQAKIKTATPQQLSQMAQELAGGPSQYQNEYNMLQAAQKELQGALDEVSRGDYLKQQASKPGDTFNAFGQTFHDKDVLENSLAFESWDNQLNSLLTEYQGIQEGMTVSISKGQQGTPDSVSVSAQDSEAEQLLNIIKHAGLGLFGGDEAGKSSPMSVVASGDEPAAEIDVVNDHDGMMDLIKKVTGGSVGPQGGEIATSHDHGEDYDEEGDEEKCNECGMYESDCGCDHEQVDEVESEDQMTYQVAEDNPPDSGAAEVDAEDASVAAQNAGASSHGGAVNSNVEESEDELEESFANGADDTFETDADFMINDITSGLNKRKATGQTTIPVISGQKSRMHSHNTTDVSEAINDWKALAGIR